MSGEGGSGIGKLSAFSYQLSAISYISWPALTTVLLTTES
jgi:hypothetical protein